jgi:hypothetical protein
MSRSSYFRALLATLAPFLLLLSCSLTVSAQTTEPKSHIQHVSVRGTGDNTEIEIKTSGSAVTPNTQAITGPDRIIIDFPGAVPADEIRALALKVNSGALKGIRCGLFFNNPPITRIVLDLASPQSYHISSSPNQFLVKLGAATTDSAKAASPKLPAKNISAKHNADSAFGPDSPNVSVVRTPRLHNALLAGGTKAVTTPVSVPVVTPQPAPVLPPPPSPPPTLQPVVTVTFESGMLTIHANKATLAQVLFEVQQQTQAEIAIPAGAEQEQVIADLGPAPARDVLGALLNGSPYNFIFVGNELALERVILTKRDPNNF